MFLLVLWMILMVAWLLGGGYVHYHGPTPGGTGYFVGGTIVPWVCVAILGYILFSDVPMALPPRVR